MSFRCSLWSQKEIASKIFSHRWAWVRVGPYLDALPHKPRSVRVFSYISKRDTRGLLDLGKCPQDQDLLVSRSYIAFRMTSLSPNPYSAQPLGSCGFFGSLLHSHYLTLCLWFPASGESSCLWALFHPSWSSYSLSTKGPFTQLLTPGSVFTMDLMKSQHLLGEPYGLSLPNPFFLLAHGSDPYLNLLDMATCLIFANPHCLCSYNNTMSTCKICMTQHPYS